MSYIDFMHKLIKCISEYYIDCINECFIFIALIRRYKQAEEKNDRLTMKFLLHKDKKK